jgi:hypothetical protein
MRKRTYLLGSLVLALSVCFAAVAQAAVTSQKAEWVPNPSPTKQFKKKPKGGVGLGVRVEADYDNLEQTGPGGVPSSHAELAVIHFDKDLAFNGGTIPQCATASIQTATTDQAKAACPNSVIGTGDAHLNGVLGPASAVVTAFRGVSSGGNLVVLLHARVGAPLNSTQVLTGTIEPSSKAGQGFGKQLRVPVAPIAGGQIVILDFQTQLPKKVSKKGKKAKKIKKGKKKGKKGKKKPPTFLISGNCSDRTWNLAGDFTFVDSPGGAAEPTFTLTGTDTAPCKQKKAKKKK